jgi:hypothetical protein
MADTNQPPFMPVTFIQQTPANLGGGGATPYSGPMEDGPGTFQNPANTGPPVRYTGQSQTAFINVSYTKPPTSRGPGPADPVISSAAQASGGPYVGTGYGPVQRGTLGIGNIVPVAQTGVPAQVRFFVGTDGNLYALDNNGNVSYKIVAGGAQAQVLPVYSPTR